MSLFDYFMSTEEGKRRLASAELRYEVLEALHTALSESGLTQVELAKKLGVRKSAVKAAFGGDGNIPVDTVAEYLAAMGVEANLQVAPLGTQNAQREERLNTERVAKMRTQLKWNDMVIIVASDDFKNVKVITEVELRAAESKRTDFALVG